MFSLAKFVDEQLNFFGDVLDKRPSQVSRSLRDPLLLVLDDNLPLKSKVSTLLTSELASQKVWAITNIARLVSMNIECDDLVKEIPRCFLSKSAKVELAAAKTAYALLWHDSAHYTPFFLKPIIDRISAVPAIEYAQCIELMAPSISPDESFSSFMPLIKKLFEKDESHQHAGSMVVKNIPSLSITEEDFNNILLNSKVFVNEYLSPTIAHNFSHKHNEYGINCLEVTLPNKLIELEGKDKSYREGVTKFFIDFMDRIKIQTLYSNVHNGFEWATSNPKIALAIIQRIEIISKSRFVDLVNKVYLLLPYIANCNDCQVRKMLPKALIEHPSLFKGPESSLKTVFTQLGNDKDPNVKIAFLENLDQIYNSLLINNKNLNGKNENLDGTLLTLYQSLLKDSDIKVVEKLITDTPLMFVALAKNRPPSIMNLFIQVLKQFQNRWRFFTRILREIEQFPTPTLVSGIKPLLTIICEAVKINPQALVVPVTSFFAFCIHQKFDCLKLPDLLKFLAFEFGKSPDFHLRIVYIKLAQSLLDEFDDDRQFFIEHIWSFLYEYKDEKVEFVYIKLLEFLADYVQKYKVRDSVKQSQEVQTVLNNKKFIDSTNPEIHNLVEYIRPLLPSHTRSLSAQPSLDKIPSIVDKSSPRLKRPIRTSSSPNHPQAHNIQNHLPHTSQSNRMSAPTCKNIPRPVASSNRKTSPKITSSRRSSYNPSSPMIKSSSNSGISSMRFPRL